LIQNNKQKVQSTKI